MDLNKMRWLLIEISNQNHAELKKLNRTDGLGLYLLERSRLMDQTRKINEVIEEITAAEVGSSLYATMKKEG